VVKKVIWTPEAEKSFDSILIYLQENWSQRQIIDFIKKTDDVVQHIVRFPRSYRSAGKEDVREALITKQNFLLYRVSAETVYLLFFWDTRKNPSKKPV
jgi:plasmid stabilization system protein ParE